MLPVGRVDMLGDRMPRHRLGKGPFLDRGRRRMRPPRPPDEQVDAGPGDGVGQRYSLDQPDRGGGEPHDHSACGAARCGPGQKALTRAW